MREIIFRAKMKLSGRWCEGFLVKTGNHFRISTRDDLISYGVDPETVGQFTGFYDSTKWEELTPVEQQAFLHQPDGWENTPDVWPGKRIFEGDILKFDDVGETGYEYKEGFDYTNRAAVVWENGRWELDRFLDTNSGVVEEMNGCSYHEDFIQVFGVSKVIGNIHDNPELLEEV